MTPERTWGVLAFSGLSCIIEEKRYIEWLTDFLSSPLSLLTGAQDISLIISTGFLLLSWRAILEECIVIKMFCPTFSKVCLLCKIVLNSSVLFWVNIMYQREYIHATYTIRRAETETVFFYVFRKFLLWNAWWLLLLWHISCWLGGPLNFAFQLYW